MNDTAGRLRDAYQAAAATVDAEQIRGLHEFRTPGHRSRHRDRARRGRAGLLMPLGAAAAVVALLLAVTAIVPRLSGGGHHPAGTTPGAGTDGGVPEFTLVIVGGALQVIQTTTGQVAGRAAAPAGQGFSYVAAAAGDRTFLAAAQVYPTSACGTILYKVQLTADGQPSLTRLDVTLPTATQPDGLALSGDGSTAAFSLEGCTTPPPGSGGKPLAGGIALIRLASGQVTRQWSYASGEPYALDLATSSLWLSADGSKLGFLQYPKDDTAELGARTLDTSAPSGPVDSVSTTGLHQPPSGYPRVETAGLSPDGATLYACTLSGPGNAATLTLAAYGATTGQRTGVLHTWPAATGSGCDMIIDPAGGYALVTIVRTTLVPDKNLPPGAKTLERTSTTVAINLASGDVSGTVPLPRGTTPVAW
jgi:hypothetical protein